MPAQSPWVQIDPALQKSNPEAYAYALAHPEEWAAAQAAAKQKAGPYSSFTDGVTGVSEPNQYVGRKMLINGNKPQKNPPLQIDIQPSSFTKKAPAAKPRLRAAPQVTPPPQPAVQQAPPPAAAEDNTYYGADDTEYLRLLAKLDEAKISGLDMQKEGLAAQEADLAEVKEKEPKVDLSALMNYSDTTYGSNLLAAYKRPLDQEALDAQERGLQEAIQKNRQGLTEDQIKVLDSALTAEGRRLGIDETSLNRKAINDNTNALNKYKADQANTTDLVGIGAGITRAQIAAGAKNGGPNGKPISEKALTSIQEYDDGVDILREIIAEKPFIPTGPGANVRNSMGQLVGNDDPRVSAFRAQVQDRFAVYVHKLSGAASSPQERAFLAQNTIRMSDSDETFMRKANALRDHLQKSRGRYVEYLGKSGRNVEGFKTPPAAAPAAPAASTPAAPARKVMSVKDLP